MSAIRKAIQVADVKLPSLLPIRSRHARLRWLTSGSEKEFVYTQGLAQAWAVFFPSPVCLL